MVGTGSSSDENTEDTQDYRVLVEEIDRWRTQYPAGSVVVEQTRCDPNCCSSVYLEIKSQSDLASASVFLHASEGCADYTVQVQLTDHSFFIGGGYDPDKVKLAIEPWIKGKPINLFELMSSVVTGNVEVTEYSWNNWVVGQELCVELPSGDKVKSRDFPLFSIRSLLGWIGWNLSPSQRREHHQKSLGYF